MRYLTNRHNWLFNAEKLNKYWAQSVGAQNMCWESVSATTRTDWVIITWLAVVATLNQLDSYS